MGKKKQSAARKKRYKLVVVGDGACGKTSLLTVFMTGHFPADYVPTVFHNDIKEMCLEDEGQTVELSLWDTAGQENYDKLRPLSYDNTDVVLVCFSVDRPESLFNVERNWVKEVTHFCKGVPIVLVGNKTDLRNDEELKRSLKLMNQAPVTFGELRNMAKKINAAASLECSAKAHEGINQVFEAAVKLAIQKRHHAMVNTLKSKCVIL